MCCVIQKRLLGFAVTRMTGGTPWPRFFDSVDLWLDNLDPQSLSLLRVRVFFAADFWVACLRCFVRVNGVKARVLDTRCELGCDQRGGSAGEGGGREFSVIGARAK